jgi:hypothetical protein
VKKSTKPFITHSKFVGIALFLFIAIAPLFISAYLQGKKLWVQHEMKEALEHSKLHSITLSIHEFTWVKKNKEILINQQLFDIKEWTVKNNQYHFRGLYDKEEMAIERQIIASQNNEPINSNKKISQLAFHIPTGSIPTELHYQHSRICNKIFYIPLTSTLCVGYLSIEAPPPQA